MSFSEHCSEHLYKNNQGVPGKMQVPGLHSKYSDLEGLGDMHFDLEGLRDMHVELVPHKILMLTNI